MKKTDDAILKQVRQRREYAAKHRLPFEKKVERNLELLENRLNVDTINDDFGNTVMWNFLLPIIMTKYVRIFDQNAKINATLNRSEDDHSELFAQGVYDRYWKKLHIKNRLGLMAWDMLTAIGGCLKLVHETELTYEGDVISGMNKDDMSLYHRPWHRILRDPLMNSFIIDRLFYTPEEVRKRFNVDIEPNMTIDPAGKTGDIKKGEKLDEKVMPVIAIDQYWGDVVTDEKKGAVERKFLHFAEGHEGVLGEIKDFGYNHGNWPFIFYDGYKRSNSVYPMSELEYGAPVQAMITQAASALHEWTLRASFPKGIVYGDNQIDKFIEEFKQAGIATLIKAEDENTRMQWVPVPQVGADLQNILQQHISTLFSIMQTDAGGRGGTSQTVTTATSQISINEDENTRIAYYVRMLEDEVIPELSRQILYNYVQFKADTPDDPDIVEVVGENDARQLRFEVRTIEGKRQKGFIDTFMTEDGTEEERFIPFDPERDIDVHMEPVIKSNREAREQAMSNRLVALSSIKPLLQQEDPPMDIKLSKVVKRMLNEASYDDVDDIVVKMPVPEAPPPGAAGLPPEMQGLPPEPTGTEDISNNFNIPGL